MRFRACRFSSPALAERAIQIDDMQPLRSLGDPAPGGLNGIVVKDGLSVGAALLQAHAAPVAQVDGGVDDHVCASPLPAEVTPAILSQLRRICSPTSWLFSG